MSNVTSSSTASPDAITRGAQRTPWGPWRALIGTFASFYLAQSFAMVLISAFVQSQHWDKARIESWANGVTAQFVYVCIVEFFTVTIIYLFIRGYPQKMVRTALGLVRPRWIDLAYMLIGFMVYYLVYMAILAITNVFFSVDTTQKQQIGFDNGADNAITLAMTFICLVVLPPLIEEIVFRGFLFRGLRRFWSPVLAALITSVLFAFPHSLQGADGTLWNAALDTFALSLVLCYLREKTGSLWAGIGVHALKNLVAFLALFIFHVQ